MLVFGVLSLSCDTNVNVNQDLRRRFYLLIYKFLAVMLANKTNEYLEWRNFRFGGLGMKWELEFVHLMSHDPWNNFALPGTTELKIQNFCREREITCPFILITGEFQWHPVTTNWLLLCSSYFFTFWFRYEYIVPLFIVGFRSSFHIHCW